MAASPGIDDDRHINEAMFGHPGDLAAELNAVALNVFEQQEGQ